MTSLLDLASDLINDAKLATQSGKKVYKLEQVKEIIFHRDISLIPQLIPELFELMLDRSVPVRKFLIRLAGDALQTSHDVAAEVLALISFLIVDGNDKLLESIADVLSRHYDKLSITIALMNSKAAIVHQLPGSQQNQQPDPKDLWYQFRSVCNTLIDCISAQKSDSLRCQCIKLCEQMVLFSLQSGGGGSSQSQPQSQPDPRLRQAGVRTVQEISLHHSFINRVELEKEADSLLAKMVLWARRGGAQHAPFSAAVQCRLGQSLAVVATERPGSLKTVLPALNYLLHGGHSKSNICAQMSAMGRQQLSVGILRLLRVAPKILSEPWPEQDQLQQLRQAVTLLDGSAGNQVAPLAGSNVITLLSGVHSSDPRKRKLEQMAAAAALKAQQEADTHSAKEQAESAQESYNGYDEGVDSDTEADLDEESIRLNAVSAVDARLSAEENSCAKRARMDDLVNNLTGTSAAPSAAPSSLQRNQDREDDIASTPSGSSPALVSLTTSLAADLGDFPQNSVGNSLRLLTLVPAEPGASGARSAGHLQPIPPPVEVYSDLCMASLSKLINQTISFLPQKMYKFSHVSVLSSSLELKLVMRMSLSMSARDLDQHRAVLQLSEKKGVLTRQTIQTVMLLRSRGHHKSLLSSPSASGEGGAVPKDVLLPRTLWLVISHSLVSQERFHSLLVEGLSTSASAASSSAVKHQASEIIRKANSMSVGAGSKHAQYASGQKFDHIDLVILLLREIYIRKLANGEGAVVGIPSKVVPLGSGTRMGGSVDEASLDSPDVGGSAAAGLYEALCLVVLSRTLQRRILRPCAARVLHHLPRIPVACVQLLELLLLTGTKPVAPAGGGTPDRRGGPQGLAVDRGTRVAALEILGSLLFSSSCMNDPELFVRVLCPLLWLSVHEDFTARTGAVNCLVGACKRIERDFQPGQGLYHVRTAILLFALQAALHGTGCVKMFAQLVKHRDGYQKQQQLRSSSAAGSRDPPNSSDLMRFVSDSCWISKGAAEETGDDFAQQKMEVEDAGGGESAEGSFLDVDEGFAADCFDQGAIFSGEFTHLSEVMGGPGSGAEGVAQPEAFIKRHFHLISQLCMNKHTLLSVYFNLYEVTASVSGGSDREEDGSSDLPPQYLQHLRIQVEKEVLSIIPSLLPSRSGFSRQKHSAAPTTTPVEIISHLIQQCNMQTTLPLFCLVLEKVLDPVSMPASEGLVALGRTLFSQLSPAPNNIFVLLPLLGGMTTAEVEQLLPRVIADLSSPDLTPLRTELAQKESPSVQDTEASGGEKDCNDEQTLLLKNTSLRKSFHRITYTRPPPLSRAKLLAALHRIDLDQHPLKLKNVLDAIGLCLAEKDEYSPDVLKEAISSLLEDEIPPVALMRTVLLSAQITPEMQKFALHEVIPQMVRKKTWAVAPKVWEGVLMCVKTFNGQRDFEPTIRAFVGLPMAQLKSVITIAKDVKGILNRILRSMSTADIEECASGRWAGIEDMNIAQTAKDKEEKAKFIESILHKQTS